MTRGRRSRWTDDLNQRLIDGRMAGKTLAVLAKEFDFSLSVIKHRALQLESFLPEPPWSRRPRIVWSEALDERLLAGHQAGRSFRSLGNELGISESSAKRRLMKLSDVRLRSLPKNPPKEPEARLVLPPKKTRRCLACGKDFASKDWSNRICRGCKDRHATHEISRGITEHHLAF